MLRPIAIEDNAMVESMGEKKGLIMQLGGENHEMGLSRRDWRLFIGSSGTGGCCYIIPIGLECWSCGITCRGARRTRVLGIAAADKNSRISSTDVKEIA
jgi:hypothetical protein